LIDEHKRNSDKFFFIFFSATISLSRSLSQSKTSHSLSLSLKPVICYFFFLLSIYKSEKKKSETRDLNPIARKVNRQRRRFEIPFRSGFFLLFCFFSDFDDLRGSNHRILPRDGFSSGGFVVVAAVVAVGVPVLGAEELAASAPKSGESDLPPAAGAAVHHALRLRRGRLVRRRRIRRRRGLLGKRSLQWTRGDAGSGRRRSYSGTSGAGRGGGRGGEGGEALLTHVIRSRVSGDAAVVNAKRNRFGNLEVGFFILGFLSHGLDFLFFHKERKKENYEDLKGFDEIVMREREREREK